MTPPEAGRGPEDLLAVLNEERDRIAAMKEAFQEIAHATCGRAREIALIALEEM